ncbi:thioredoxin domain-containing protein [Candidatus Saccharibacteria bacterium]|nr:thioredoxin domain-containing protein [Candidatus Saccharibacteria bacterium]
MKAKKVIRIVALVLIGAVILALIVFSSLKGSSNEEKVWDARTTIGEMNAKNYYVMYTDLACPYCSVFSRSIMENEEEFKRDYIEGEHILFEVRVTDFLYEYGEHRTGMSRWGATGTYCATQKDKFWDYYHQALKSLWEDYHSKGIGTSKTAPQIEGMTKDYWVTIGEKVGMDGAELASCMDSGETAEAVEKMTAKAAKAVDGMPYFAFNNFKTGGFNDTWGWDYVKQYLDAGLKR